MDKVNTLGAGIALAVTLALISALCAVAFVLAPDATLDFFSAFMHGLDLKSVKVAAPLLYTAALVPPVTRLYLDQHWMSDIVAGAFLGTLLGSRVVSYAHSHRRTRLDEALLAVGAMPDGFGGVMLVVGLRR